MLEVTKFATSNIYHNLSRKVFMRVLNLPGRAELKAFLGVKQQSEDHLLIQGWKGLDPVRCDKMRTKIMKG